MKPPSAPLALAAAACLLIAPQAFAADVTPVTRSGNFTDCSQLGVAGLRGGSSVGAPADPQTFALGAGRSITFDFSPDGQARYIDFSADVPMDYVIVKGGSSYNLFHYDPARRADTHLYAPNNASGQPAEVSHVAWCFLPRPEGTKTAVAQWDRKTDWTLDKSALPDAIEMFDGDTHEVQYTVTATPTSTGHYRVSGVIRVYDPFGYGWVVTRVADILQFDNNAMQFPLFWDGPGGATDTLQCSRPPNAEGGLILQCDYTFELSSADYPFLVNSGGGVNAAGITAKRPGCCGGDGDGGSGSGSGETGCCTAPGSTTTVTALANFTIPVNPATSHGDTLEVDDSMLPGDPDHVFDLDGPYAWRYERPDPVACDADEGRLVNTATGTWSTPSGSGQTSDSATVDVACGTVQVSKTAVTRYHRDYAWSPDKKVVVDGADARLQSMEGCQASPIAEGGVWDGFYLCDDIEIRLNPDGVYDTVYRLAAARSTEEDDGFAVGGTIEVSWTAGLVPDFDPAAPTDTLTFTDAGNGTQAVSPSCGAKGVTSLSCTYDTSLPRDFVPGYNQAAITRVRKCYDASGVPTDCGTRQYTSPQVPLSYGGPATESDACVLAEDLFNGTAGLNLGGSFSLPLGEQCASFSRYVTGVVEGNSFDILAAWIRPDLTGPGNACTFLVPNLLTVGTDNGGTRSDEAVVTVDVPELCATGGCTYTQGYWKTHSNKGPAPYDATWASIGENTLFFGSGLTWYEVFWTPPQQGNAYFILAHQYMAARLNVEAGAAVPAQVQSAITQATGWFTGRGSQAPKGNDRRIALDLASVLAAYNEGDLGPGHCSVSPAAQVLAR